MTHYGWLAG